MSKIITSQRSTFYDEYDKQDVRLSTDLLSSRGVYAPFEIAVYDAYKRRNPSKSSRISSLYDLPILASIHRAWSARHQASRTRVLHPFNEVDRNLNKALDQNSKLYTTILPYLLKFDRRT